MVNPSNSLEIFEYDDGTPLRRIKNDMRFYIKKNKIEIKYSRWLNDIPESVRAMGEMQTVTRHQTHVRRTWREITEKKRNFQNSNSLLSDGKRKSHRDPTREWNLSENTKRMYFIFIRNTPVYYTGL